MIKIEKNVPVPKVVRKIPGAKPKFPFADMEIGDSFEVADRTTKSFASTASAATRRTGKKFTLRATDGGVRIWRVA